MQLHTFNSGWHFMIVDQCHMEVAYHHQQCFSELHWLLPLSIWNLIIFPCIFIFAMILLFCFFLFDISSTYSLCDSSSLPLSSASSSSSIAWTRCFVLRHTEAKWLLPWHFWHFSVRGTILSTPNVFLTTIFVWLKFSVSYFFFISSFFFLCFNLLFCFTWCIVSSLNVCMLGRWSLLLVSVASVLSIVRLLCTIFVKDFGRYNH